MTSRVLLFIFALLFSSAVQAGDAVQTYAAEGEALLKGLPDSVRGLLDYAVSQAGVAYRRGGASPEAGFDCSGFVRYVFDHVEGLSLPHSSKAMSLIGNRIKLADSSLAISFSSASCATAFRMSASISGTTASSMPQAPEPEAS